MIPQDYLNMMLTNRGGLSGINHGTVPVHNNPDIPPDNKGIDWETGIILSNFIEKYRPQQVVELGTFRGYSTSWLILGTLLAGTGRVDAFEVFAEGAYGAMWYDRYNLPKQMFKYHEIPGGIWKFPNEIPETIDLLYHDTEHLLNPTKMEMELLLPRIPPGGIVLVDDMLHPDYKAMQEYFHNLFCLPPLERTLSFEDFQKRQANRSWNWSVLPIGHGLGIARRLK